MDAPTHTSFCIPLRQRSSHAAKPGDEGGVPPRSLSLSSQSHSSRLDSSNESYNRNNTAMDVLPAKVDKFASFISCKFYFSANLLDHCVDKYTCCASQKSESLNDDQTNLTKVVPLSGSQSTAISCDNSKSFLLKSITPYVQQTTPVSKTTSEVIQPPVPPSAHLINGSLSSNQTLPLPHCSFSFSTANATIGVLPHGPHYDRAADEGLCSVLVKEVLHEGHCCENAPRRLRLKTTDGSSSGLRSTYGRYGWHDGPRQSMLPYSGPGASRCYTKPSPSLPLLPLGQAYSRGAPRRVMLSSFPESH
uniref:DUF4585 domain-containing protein n=1 Tax=Elaeophora elaphi TaxID=1147741 RepID=A0A0R3RPG7_9BILA